MFDWLYSTGAAAITAVTASVAGTVGAVGSVLGCTSAGITAGSAMAGMMSTAAQPCLLCSLRERYLQR